MPVIRNTDGMIAALCEIAHMDIGPAQRAARIRALVPQFVVEDPAPKYAEALEEFVFTPGMDDEGMERRIGIARAALTAPTFNKVIAYQFAAQVLRDSDKMGIEPHHGQQLADRVVDALRGWHERFALTVQPRPTVREIVAAYLRANGFDGLCSADDDDPCGCGLDDLSPCTGDCNCSLTCQPAYYHAWTADIDVESERVGYYPDKPQEDAK